MQFYGVTMAAVAAFAATMSGEGRPVLDRTGLKGRYDVLMRTPESGGGAVDRQEMVQGQMDALGLKLEAGRAAVERLVVDHMERPSAN